ncbi:MAG: flagellar motor protein MotB [Pseudomonadota bacterium]|nr:flagellar motor protein MotB [Pseudomonadota bacterium]
MAGAKPKKPKGGGGSWLTTFTDLICLMLTFFVLLFSMSETHEPEWNILVSALASNLNPMWSERENEGVRVGVTLIDINQIEAVNLEYLATLLPTQIQNKAVLNKISITKLDDRLVIAMPNELLFKPGRAGIGSSGLAALDVLGGQIAKYGFPVEVHGHSAPSNDELGDTYPSNWELSLTRAAAVAYRLYQNGFPEPIVIYGLSDTRFGDLSPDLPLDKRTSLARRVDIVIRDKD